MSAICKWCDKVIYKKGIDIGKVPEVWTHFAKDHSGCGTEAKPFSIFARKSLGRILTCINCARDIAIVTLTGCAGTVFKDWAHLDTRSQECHYQAEPKR